MRENFTIVVPGALTITNSNIFKTETKSPNFLVLCDQIYIFALYKKCMHFFDDIKFMYNYNMQEQKPDPKLN